MSTKLRSIGKLIMITAAVILVAYMASQVFFRIDLTSEKRYTLTNVTQKTLEGLDSPVYIKVYLTGDQLPPGFRRLEKASREMLEEFIAYAEHDIIYEFVNPAEVGNEQERNQFYKKLRQKGLDPVELTERTKSDKTSRQIVFPGAVFTYKDREIAVNFLKTQAGQSPRENLNSSVQALEYEFINAIHKLSMEKRKKVGIARGHGELPDENLQDLGKILSEYYTPQRVLIDSQATNLQQYAAILFPRPTKPFTEKEKFLIDQYLMQGGSLMFLMDGVKIDMDSLRQRSFAIGIANDLNLQDMLFNYGIRVNHELVMDEQCLPIGLTQMQSSGESRIQLFPWPYNPLIVPSGKTHPITRYLSPVRTHFISTIDTVKTPGVHKEILLRTSKNSQVKPVPSRVSFEIISRQPNWQFQGGPYPVSALAEGRFESVFANRLLAQKFNYNQPIRQKSKPASVIVAADGDLAKNRIARSGEPYPMGFDRNARKNYKGNSDFMRNAVNYLCDDGGLMQVRMRELKLRLLNQDKIETERFKWQAINTAVPIIFIILLGIIFNVYRKKTYAKQN